MNPVAHSLIRVGPEDTTISQKALLSLVAAAAQGPSVLPQNLSPAPDSPAIHERRRQLAQILSINPYEYLSHTELQNYDPQTIKFLGRLRYLCATDAAIKEEIALSSTAQQFRRDCQTLVPMYSRKDLPTLIRMFLVERVPVINHPLTHEADPGSLEKSQRHFAERIQKHYPDLIDLHTHEGMALVFARDVQSDSYHQHYLKTRFHDFFPRLAEKLAYLNYFKV